MHLENKYCAKHRHLHFVKPERVPSNNIFPSAIASGFNRSSFNPYVSSRDDEDFLTPINVATAAPR
jgi:hypothetical protein